MIVRKLAETGFAIVGRSNVCAMQDTSDRTALKAHVTLLGLIAGLMVDAYPSSWEGRCLSPRQLVFVTLAGQVLLAKRILVLVNHAVDTALVKRTIPMRSVFATHSISERTVNFIKTFVWDNVPATI